MTNFRQDHHEIVRFMAGKMKRRQGARLMIPAREWINAARGT
jgi:hypothetical protein